MIDILITKMKLLIRKPGTFLGMTAMTIIMALVVGFGSSSGTEIPVYTADDSVRTSMAGHMIEETDNNALTFNWTDEQQAIQQVKEGEAEMNVALGSDGYNIQVGVQSGLVDKVDQIIQQAYTKQTQYHSVMDAAADKGQDVTVSDIDQAIDERAFDVNAQNMQEGSTSDSSYFPIFGFTLFFVIYTIGTSVFQIQAEKREGVWDRVILSPVKKWQVYTANFLYSFLIGYFQIALVFGIFKFLAGVDFGGSFAETLLVISAYVFAIVALCILLTGFARTGQQFNALISITALAIAMIGGMFWPLGIVESDIMIGLSKLVPTTYGLELVTDVAVLDQSLKDILYPFSILIVMGVLMAGIGIHLMERRLV